MDIRKLLIICIEVVIVLVILCLTMIMNTEIKRPVSMEECWDNGNLNKNNLYCKGFDDGYNWQRTQVLMDCEFAKIDKLLK